VNAPLARASARFAARHPGQVLLAALGVALGVAVVTAVDLTEASARHAFDDAMGAIMGRATHQVLGGPRGVDEAVYSRLRRAGIAPTAAPLIEATVTVPALGDARIRLLGVDPLLEPPLRAYWAGIGEGVLVDLLARPGTALLSPALAARLPPGQDRLRIRAAGHEATVELLGPLDSARRHPALAGTELLLVDLATAQELLGLHGHLTRIDLALASPAEERAVRAWLPPDTDLVAAATRTQAAAGMTAAFHTNLAALGLLALLVGMFLVYNSQTFMVLQRRTQFGILRALGLRRRELAALVLLEAGVLGLAGTAAGLGLGVLLARVLLGLVSQTINDLYYALAVDALVLDGGALAKAALLGVGGSVAAALVPALEATRAGVRQTLDRAALEHGSARAARRAAAAATALAGIGAAVLALPFESVRLGFAGLFCVILACALATPVATMTLVRALERRPIARRHLEIHLALRGVSANLSRTGVAAAALMLAVATTIGIGVMVGSFRAAVADWLDTVLRADWYIAAAAGPAGATPLQLDLLPTLAEVPGVNALSHVRRVEIGGRAGSVTVAAYGLNEAARAGFELLAGERPPARFWTRFDTTDTVMVSEPYARKQRLGPGDRLDLRTGAGYRSFQVGAVYRDYASDRGVVAMSRATYDRHWHDRGLSGIGLYTGAGFDVEALRARLEARLGTGAQFEITANRAIRDASLAVFDRTFTITEVLRLLAGAIAFIGVFSALLAIELERERVHAIMKAVGVSAAQLRRIVLGETAIIGAAAGLLAVPVGLAIAALLVYVINRRSFGWTMALHADAVTIGAGVALALVAALLAGLYPAARMARARPATVLRGE